MLPSGDLGAFNAESEFVREGGADKEAMDADVSQDGDNKVLTRKCGGLSNS